MRAVARTLLNSPSSCATALVRSIALWVLAPTWAAPMRAPSPIETIGPTLVDFGVSVVGDAFVEGYGIDEIVHLGRYGGDEPASGYAYRAFFEDVAEVERAGRRYGEDECGAYYEGRGRVFDVSFHFITLSFLPFFERSRKRLPPPAPFMNYTLNSVRPPVPPPRGSKKGGPQAARAMEGSIPALGGNARRPRRWMSFVIFCETLSGVLLSSLCSARFLF